MSESNKSSIVEKVTWLFDSKRELFKFFLLNAATKHAVPYDPEDDVTVKERTIEVQTTKTDEQPQQKTEQQPITPTLPPNPPKQPEPDRRTNGNGSIFDKLKKNVIPLILAGTVGAGGVGLYNYFFGGDKGEVIPTAEPQSRDGSLFQYLEDGGFHRPND